MAKSSRASSRKANNQRLKKNVFAPIESARAERLSAKLLELAAQPKPRAPGKDAEAEDAMVDDAPARDTDNAQATKEDDAMDIDMSTKAATSRSPGKKRIEKRRAKKSSIVFPKYKDRAAAKKKR